MNLILFRGSLNNYLVWKLVQKFMPYLSKAFTEVVDLYRKHLTGAQKPAQRWEFCADTTQMFFGHLMDSLLFQSQVSKGRVKKTTKFGHCKNHGGRGLNEHKPFSSVEV